MQVPVQVTFRDMPVSDAVEAACLEEAAKLERYYERITSCHVTVAEPHRQHRQGNSLEVRIRLVLPGTEINVSREPPAQQRDEDPYIALREAFDTTRRQLEDFVRRRRDRTMKPPEAPPHGRVTRLFADQGYGFITATDGREIYFHRRSVLNDGFDRLELDGQVRFVEEEGDKGPQASTVTPVGRHHRLED